MSQDVDTRIAEVLARRAGKSSTTQTPGGKPHDIVVEQGSTPLAQQSVVGPGQIDATVHFDPVAENAAAKEAALAKKNDPNIGKPGYRIGDNFTTTSGEGSEAVKIGTVTLRKTGLEGFEKNFTRNASDYQLVLEDGTVVNSIHEIVKLLHAECYRIKLSKEAK